MRFVKQKYVILEYVKWLGIIYDGIDYVFSVFLEFWIDNVHRLSIQVRLASDRFE